MSEIMTAAIVGGLVGGGVAFVIGWFAGVLSWKGVHGAVHEKEMEMTAYTKLVKTLRYEATRCEDFPEQKKLFLDAANAIEELSKKYIASEIDNTNLTGWLAEEHANQCPHYIRNVHDRGDDSLCDRFMCEVKTLPKWIPVTERLPEGKDSGFSDDVLILVKEQDGDFIWEDVYSGYYLYDAVSDETGWWAQMPQNCQQIKERFSVTHWMPLPPPPQKGEQDG